MEGSLYTPSSFTLSVVKSASISFEQESPKKIHSFYKTVEVFEWVWRVIT